MKEIPVLDYKNILKKFQKSESDTGSSGVQIVHLTRKIIPLSLHLTKFKKDSHSLRGLVGMLNTRRSLLQYVKKYDLVKYNTLLKELHIRK